jgi:DNA-damage-inducible protein J
MRAYRSNTRDHHFAQIALDKILLSDTKAAASKARAALGLSVSVGIRMMLRRVVDEKRLPFKAKVPNAESLAAKQELEAGKVKRFKSADALFDDLGI